MNHLPNVFKNFDNLYQIDISRVQSKLPFTLHPVVIENYVANRLLFPYAIPQTKQEVQLELAILSAVVALNSGYFYNQALSKINIPADYTLAYQNIHDLVESVITSVGLHGQASIIIPNPAGHDTKGSAIALPPVPSSTINYVGKSYTLSSGGFLHLLPSADTALQIDGQLYQVTPDELGIYIFYANE